jgi:hypothetical protein
MTDPTRYRQKTRIYSGTAFISLGCALAALVLIPIVPALSVVAAVVAVIGGLLARRDLKANPELSGTGFSLAGFLLGAGILVVQFLPVIFSVMFLATYN